MATQTDADIEKLRAEMQTLRSDRIKSLNISPNVHYAIQKMMAKDPGIRYQEPEAIVTDIDAYLDSIGFRPITTSMAVKEDTDGGDATAPRKGRRKAAGPRSTGSSRAAGSGWSQGRAACPSR